MSNLTWSGASAFNAAAKVPLADPNPANAGATGAFVKSSPGGQLTMYYVLNAGHMIPADQPYMALKMFTDILSA